MTKQCVKYFSFFPVFCQRTPIITHITQKPIKDIGDTVELTCSVLYAREFPVLWVKVVSDDIVVISNGYAIVIKDSRFTTNQDIDHDRYTLKVANGNEWTPFNDLNTVVYFFIYTGRHLKIILDYRCSRNRCWFVSVSIVYWR